MSFKEEFNELASEMETTKECVIFAALLCATDEFQQVSDMEHVKATHTDMLLEACDNFHEARVKFQEFMEAQGDGHG